MMSYGIVISNRYGGLCRKSIVSLGFKIVQTIFNLTAIIAN